MRFVHVLDPDFDCDNLDILHIHLHRSGIYPHFVLELIQCYFRLTSSIEAILCQDGPPVF